MRLSAKGRYALAAMIDLAHSYDSPEFVTVISISERLGISKIYLEQVFSLLKRGGLVNSVKGAQGGYYLSRSPLQITVYDILFAVELSLFETTEESVREKAPEIDETMKVMVFDILDEAIADTLKFITLDELLHEALRRKQGADLMYYI